MNLIFWVKSFKDTTKRHFKFCSCLDAHDTSSVVLQWEDDHPIELHVDKLNLPQFELLEYRPTECKEEYKTGNGWRILQR